MQKELMGQYLTGEEKSETLASLQELIGKCKKCKLNSSRKNTVFGSGSLNAKIMFIGESPGEAEDESGLPFVGDAGKKLDDILSHLKIERDDCYMTNVIKCHPPQSRTPNDIEINKCNYYLKQQIEVVSPHVIVSLGVTSSRTLLCTDDFLADMRLENIHTESPFWENNEMSASIPIICTYHPAHVLRNPDKQSLFLMDIKKTLDFLI